MPLRAWEGLCSPSGRTIVAGCALRSTQPVGTVVPRGALKTRLHVESVLPRPTPARTVHSLAARVSWGGPWSAEEWLAAGALVAAPTLGEGVLVAHDVHVAPSDSTVVHGVPSGAPLPRGARHAPLNLHSIGTGGTGTVHPFNVVVVWAQSVWPRMIPTNARSVTSTRGGVLIYPWGARHAPLNFRRVGAGGTGTIHPLDVVAVWAEPVWPYFAAQRARKITLTRGAVLVLPWGGARLCEGRKRYHCNQEERSVFTTYPHNIGTV